MSQWTPALEKIADGAVERMKQELEEHLRHLEPGSAPVTAKEILMRMRVEIDVALMYLDNYFQSSRIA
jgi:hypothetical protein